MTPAELDRVSWARALAHWARGDTYAAWSIAARHDGAHWRKLTDMCLRRFAGVEPGEPLPDVVLAVDDDDW